MTRKVRLHIGHVVLDGVDPGDRPAFERALKTRIAEALGAAAAGGTLSGLRSRANVDGGRIARPADPSALVDRIVSRLTGGGGL